MSVVSSYIIFGYYFSGDFKKVVNKMLEIKYSDLDDDFNYVVNKDTPVFEDTEEPDLKEFGDKVSQFGQVRVFAFNKFNDDYFEEWLLETKPEDVTVLLNKEHESQPRIIYTQKTFD